MWLWSKKRDGLFLFAGMLLVPLPLVLHKNFHFARDFIALIASFFFVGPHLLGTTTYTLLEKRFWKNDRLTWLGLFPVIVGSVILEIKARSLFFIIFGIMTLFHYIHQVLFVLTSYDRRFGIERSRLDRFLDWILLLISFVPFLSQKFMTDEGFFKEGVFIVSLSLLITSGIFYFLRVIWQYRLRQIHWPKTIFLGLTVMIHLFLFFPQSWEFAFLGYSLAHAFQYLIIVFMMNQRRYVRKRITSPFVSGISKIGSGGRFYWILLAMTVFLFGILEIIFWGNFEKLQKIWFSLMMILLVVHQYLDCWTFLKRKELSL